MHVSLSIRESGDERGNALVSDCHVLQWLHVWILDTSLWSPQCSQNEVIYSAFEMIASGKALVKSTTHLL